MEKVLLFSEVLQYLKDGIVLCTRNPKLTYFFIKDGKIVVKNASSRYCISLEELKELFGKEVFYIYQDNQESVDNKKDEEYYQWKSQGMH